MTRSLHRLTDRSVRALGPGTHCDGGGLYLQVTEGKTEGKPDGVLRRSWLFRFATGETAISRNGKPRQVERQMGLGGYPDVTLAEARQKAAEARKLRRDSIDPITHRN